jgi:TrpR family trp operon transcriptional repressor
MIQSRSQKTTREILDFLAEVKEKDLSNLEYEQLLKVFLTPAEIDAISQRLQIVDMISKGIAQREISEKLGVGIATVTRGSRMLQENSDLLRQVFPRQELNLT